MAGHLTARRGRPIIVRVNRFALPAVMNVVVPGTGLIGLGRPWLGLALAVWFTLGVETAVCGWLIAPATIPLWIVLAGAGLAVAAWGMGQGLLATRIRSLQDPHLPEELTPLRELAAEALARGDYEAVRSALRVAMDIDDSDLETRVLWARLLTASGRRRRARRAWLSAARLDGDRAFADEIDAALERLGGR